MWVDNLNKIFKNFLTLFKNDNRKVMGMTFKNKIKTDIMFTCYEYGIINKDAIKYILATVEHETNGTYKPVKEAYWLSEKWREKHLRYYPYYGRGFVQITWKENYEKFGKLLDVDLVNNPDLALNYDIAIKILVIGMKDGLFTGKKLRDYFNEEKSDFVVARRIINGMDRAHHIADIARNMKLP